MTRGLRPLFIFWAVLPKAGESTRKRAPITTGSATQFPHYFYAVLARQRVRDKVADAVPDDDAVMWLEDVEWPEHRDLSSMEPNAATAHRIDRARLLMSAGLPDLGGIRTSLRVEAGRRTTAAAGHGVGAECGLAVSRAARDEELQRRLSFAPA